MIKILYIEDDSTHIELTQRLLENSEVEFNLRTASTITDAFSLIKDNEFDVILSDYLLPDGSGLDVIRIALELKLPTAIVLITSQDDTSIAVAALKAGAVDYIVKQSDYLHKLPIVLSNAYKHTQIEKQKKELNEIENKYRNIFDNAVEGIFQSSPDGRLLSVNPAMAQIFGYASPEEMIEKITDISARIHLSAKSREQFSKILTELGMVENYEARNLKKDGGIIWTSTNARIVKDKNGKSLYYEGTITDITKQKNTEKAILEAEERYRILVEKLPAVIFMDKFNDLQSTQYISPRIKELLGYTPEEWETDHNIWESSLHPDDKDRVLAEDIRTNKSGEPFRIEYRLRHRDGHYVWIKEDASIIFGEDGASLFWHGILLNITEQKYAEEAIKANEGSYRELFNSVTQAIYIQDRDGHFLDVNEGAIKMYGYPREFFIGKTPEVLSAPNKNDLNDLVELTERAFAGEPQEFEFWGIRSNGQIFPKVVTLNKGTYFGKDVIIAIAQDVTVRKQTEKILERQLKALTVLHVSSMAGTQSNTEDEIIEQVTRITASIYSDVCGVILLNDQGDILTPHPSYIGANISNWENGYPVTDGITGRAARTGNSIRINDTTKDPSYIEIATETKSEICVPFRVHERIIGIFNVESKQFNAFDEEDEFLLNTIAGVLGTAIEKLRLFETEQTQRQRETAILDLIRVAASSLDLNQVLQSILNQLIKVIPSDGGSIQLLDGDRLNIPASIGNETMKFAKRGPFLLSEFPLNNYIITEKQIIRIDNALLDDRYRFSSEITNMRSFLGIPLIAKDRTIGMIALDSYEISHFTEQDAELGLALANHASIAIENAHLFDAEQKRRKEAEIVRQAATILSSLLDLPSLHEAILEWLYKIIPYDSASILEIDGDHIRITAAKGIPNLEKVLDQTFPSDNILCKIINETGEPLIIEDCEKDARFESWGDVENIHGWMGAPLITRGRVIGYITIDSDTPNAFTINDAIAVQTFAHQAANSLENSRLYTETLQRLDELEMVSRVSYALRAAHDTKEMIPILLNEIKANMSTDSAAIWLYNLEKNELTPIATSGLLNDLPKSTFKPNEGIVGAVYASGTMHISPALSPDPMIDSENYNFFGNGWGGITIPIRTVSETIGALVVAIPAPQKIGRNHIRLITTLTEIAGNAIYRSNLFERSEEQIRRLTTLREMDTAITSSLDLHITLGILTDHLLTKMDVSAATVLVFNPDSQTLNYYAPAGFKNHENVRASQNIGEGLASQTLLSRKEIYINDLSEEPHLLQSKPLKSEHFVTYYAMPLFSKGATKGVLETYFRQPFSPSADWLDFLHMLAEQAIIAIDNAQLFESLQRSNQELSLAYDTTLEGWGKALELRDKETKGHTNRVTSLTLELARQMNIPETELLHIRRGSLLHDIGKMGVSDSILHKNGPLTKDEQFEMRKHPKYAYDLLYPITYLRPALDIAYCHHEWWDGSGYPRGLKGEEIPLSARIFAIIDVWDALLSDRPYRDAWSHTKTLKYIKDLSDKQFDPLIVEVFCKMIESDSEYMNPSLQEKPGKISPKKPAKTAKIKNKKKR